MKREEAKRKALELGLEQEEEAFELAGDKFGIIKTIGKYAKKTREFLHKVRLRGSLHWFPKCGDASHLIKSRGARSHHPGVRQLMSDQHPPTD